MKIAIGSAQFGSKYGLANSDGPVPRPEVIKILQLARENGISCIDTARAYGSSEEVLGGFGMVGWDVITKLPRYPSLIPIEEWVEQSIGESLAHLNIDSIYGLLLHYPMDLFGAHGQKLYASLIGLKNQGLIKKIGVSIYSPEELDRILDKFDIDLVQSPCNLLDRRILESGWADSLDRAGIELHVRSVFLQGLLLNNGLQESPPFNKWWNVWEELERWRSNLNISIFGACLQFPISEPKIKKVVIGVDSVEQLNQIITVPQKALPYLPIFSKPLEIELINPALWTKS
jgi:aryl-alcohol dehydrogenase-like predicted oxidoreductase